MSNRKLFRVVVQNIARSKKNFVFSSIGIIVGISTFTFFIALSQGVKERVLNRIFPIDQLEVESMGGVADSGDDSDNEGLTNVLAARPRSLDKNAVGQLEAISGVTQAYPKMRARFPAKVETGVLDRRMAGEGFLEGLEISQSLIDEMAANEAMCSDASSEDICQRREVSCMSDVDCPHQGMACLEKKCRPRQYWRNFSDRHARPECTQASDCDVGQVCAYDRWIIIKTADGVDRNSLRDALQLVTHPVLSADFYVPVSMNGAVTLADIDDADRVNGEVWSIGGSVALDVTNAAEKKGVVLRNFENEKQAFAHIQALPSNIKTGECAGAPCTLNKAEKEIGSWKYFLHYENHFG